MLEKAALLLGQARGAYQREQYEIALAYFRRARQVDPHSPEALLGIGEVAAYMELRGEAIDAFLTLADIYTQAGMLEVAAEVVERVLELDSVQPLARRFQQFIRGRLRRPTSDREESVVTTLDRQRRVQHKLSEQPSETSLAQLVPWAESEDSQVSQQVTSVAASELDGFVGQLSEPKTPGEQREQSMFSDTLITRAEPTIESETPLVAQAVESVVIDDDAFADVATRAAPDGLMEELAQAARSESDPFSAETVVAEPPRIRGQTLSQWSDISDNSDVSDITMVDPPSETARGSGHHNIAGDFQESAGGWDFDTTAAVMAENVRVKPRMSLEAIDFDESDFPRFDENKLDAEMITRTIALEGEGAVAAIASLMTASPLLALLDIEQCQHLIENSVVTQYFAGQIIVKEGQVGSSLYLLATGQAAVERDIEGEDARRVASISAGNFFGEGSLLADAPRSSTVRVIEDSLIVELDRELIQRIVKENSRVLTVLTRFLRARLLSTLMMDSPLFHQLPLDERTNLAPKIHLHKLNPGQTVAERGQVLTGFCTLMAGELRQFDVAQGTGKQVFGNLRPGASFGSRSLHGEPSPVSISASTGCWLLRLPTADLHDLVVRHPELAAALRDVES